MTPGLKKFIALFVFLAFALSAIPAVADEAPVLEAPSPEIPVPAAPNVPPAAPVPDHYLAGVKRIVVWTNRSSMPADLGIGPFTINWDELDAAVAKNLTLLLKPALRKRLVIQAGASAKAPAGITDKETLFVSFNFDFKPMEYNNKKAFLENIHPDIKLPAFPDMKQDTTSGYYRNVAILMSGYSKMFWPGPIKTGLLYAGTTPLILKLSQWFNNEYPLSETQKKNKDKQP